MGIATLLNRKSALIEGELIESAFTEVPAEKIDRKACVIRDVKIIGKSSERNREYTDDAIRGALHLYEGAEVNVEHPRDETQASKIRPILDGWGRLKNVKFVPGDGAYGDLHFLESHPHTPLFLERIEKGFQIGLSQNARGKWSTRGGKTLVESIPHVNSVDLVRRGATTKTLFESAPMNTTLKAILVANKPAAHDKALVALLEDVVGDPAMGGAEMPAPAADVPADDSIKEALMAAITAKLPELDSAALKKVLNAVGIGDSISKTLAGDAAAPAEGAAGGEAPKPTLESLQTTIARLEHRERVRDFMAVNNLSPVALGPQRVKLLEGQTTEAGMKTLLESWPPAVRSVKPPAAKLHSLLESADGQAAPKVPKTTDGVRQLLRS